MHQHMKLTKTHPLPDKNTVIVLLLVVEMTVIITIPLKRIIPHGTVDINIGPDRLA